ncbi:MAG: type II toxin-antitoxin system Phd/YefM family antitoxin [Acidimicrobiales bacterium]|nr:type II toxin-antitoxin system Phd/YefM family antitoxin [Acidimicrobiales bacterium]
MATAPLTEVRDNLSDIIDQVAQGAEWTVTRHGRPVAVILSFEDYESLIETVNVLSDSDTMDAIREGLADLDDD